MVLLPNSTVNPWALALVACASLTAACGSSRDPHAATLEHAGLSPFATTSPQPKPPAAARPAPPSVQAKAQPPLPPSDGRLELAADWPDSMRSLQVRAVAHVKGKPADRARYIGKVVRGTRVGWKRLVAPDPPPEDSRPRRNPCPAWVEIEPEGYLCTDLLRPSEQPPSGVPQPVVRNGRVAPDTYFKVKEDETPVYKTAEDIRLGTVEKQLSTKVMVVGYGVVNVDGISFRSTDHGLIEEDALGGLWPSKFEGRRLTGGRDEHWPFAWVYAESWGRPPPVQAAAAKDSERVRYSQRREVVPILEERDGFARIADSEWIERKHLRLARQTQPPDGVGEATQWVDVDLDEQVLVAYEGKRPIFATMVSTGRGRHATPVATYRVRAKAATTSMSGDEGVPNRYEVSGVPWAVRFADGFYIHGVYWHDGFGKPRSHGCVNVSPKDAAFLFDWVGPALPDGWSEIEVPGGEGAPVRVRNREIPVPPPFDYSNEEPWNVKPTAQGSATH